MTQEKNIGFAFLRHADSHPDKPAVIAADLSVTYAQLALIVKTFSCRMQEVGISRASTVALDTSDMIVSLATMFATALLGARFTAFEPALLENESVKPTHFLKSPERASHPAVRYIEMGPNWSPKYADDLDLAAAVFPGSRDPEDPWWLIHTSGTTGSPKYMALSQRVVFDRSAAAVDDFVPDHTVLCSLFTCTARPFYVRATAALLNRCTIVDTIDPAFMEKHGVNLVCGSPRIAIEWLGGRTLSPKPARLQVSGARLSDPDAAVLLASFETVEDVYGASETNKSFVNVKSLTGGQVVTTGKPCGSEVEITEQAFNLCQPGQIGTVRVRNPYMVAEYLEAPEATARAFQGGWFYPGDFASWGANGELKIAGRVDEIINLGGVKVNQVLVDEALMSVDGVMQAVCFRNPKPGKTGELLALLVLRDRSVADDLVPAAHQACVEALGVVSSPRRIFVVGWIPMTLDGVPRRNECQRLALTLPEMVGE